jgi:hypothetical protein
MNERAPMGDRESRSSGTSKFLAVEQACTAGGNSRGQLCVRDRRSGIHVGTYLTAVDVPDLDVATIRSIWFELAGHDYPFAGLPDERTHCRGS